MVEGGFRARLRTSTVMTWKYVDEAGAPTGATAFRMESTVWFGGSPAVGAHLTAGFRGVPVEGGAGTPEDPYTIGGDLTAVVIDVLGPVKDGDVVWVELQANLYDGTPVTGADVVRIIRKKKPHGGAGPVR
jgi:hypothetical protein